MNVTPDVIGVIVAIVGASATVFGGLYLLLRNAGAKVDEQFKDLRSEIDMRFGEMREEIKDVREEIKDMRKEIKDVREDIVELKIAVARLEVSVARLEGPQPALLMARR